MMMNATPMRASALEDIMALRVRPNFEISYKFCYKRSVSRSITCASLVSVIKRQEVRCVAAGG
jgi:hypothetical protein